MSHKSGRISASHLGEIGATAHKNVNSKIVPPTHATYVRQEKRANNLAEVLTTSGKEQEALAVKAILNLINGG